VIFMTAEQTFRHLQEERFHAATRLGLAMTVTLAGVLTTACATRPGAGDVGCAEGQRPRRVDESQAGNVGQVVLEGKPGPNVRSR
jgi:hypothetical protein